MKRQINTDNLLWMLEVKPELYSDKPKQYQIREKDYGLYTKKEAEIICTFIRRNFVKIINKAIN